MTQSPSPRLNAKTRQRAHIAMTQLYYSLHDVIRRYYDEDGMYREPTGVGDGGDNTGMIRAANNEVLRRLDSEVESTRARLMAILQEIHEYEREQIGPGYTTPPPQL